MEIIKPGKVRRIKLECQECGCEFACSKSEMEYIPGAVLFAKCPQDGCGAVVEVPIGTTLRTEMLIAYKAHDGKLYEQE